MKLRRAIMVALPISIFLWALSIARIMDVMK